MPVSSPAKGRITKPFGRQPNGSFHHGTDRGWGAGSQVYAMLGGRVVEMAFLSDYGNFIRVLHGRDIHGRVIESRYCHLKTGFNLVDEDSDVAQGEQIATMGSTGSLTDQVHLHSELWIDDIRVDETTADIQFPPPPSPPSERKRTMTTNFVDSSTFDSNGSAIATTAYATAGEYGFPWQPFTRGTLPLAQSRYQYALDVHGRFIPLSHADFLAYETEYTSGGSAVTGGFSSADRAVLESIPTIPEAESLLTSTANIINSHTTEAVNGITLTSAP